MLAHPLEIVALIAILLSHAAERFIAVVRDLVALLVSHADHTAQAVVLVVASDRILVGRRRQEQLGDQPTVGVADVFLGLGAGPIDLQQRTLPIEDEERAGVVALFIRKRILESG